MPRSRRNGIAPATPPQPASPTASALVADPHAIYTAEQVRVALRLRTSSLRREIREGRLRVSKRCGRYYILGQQLLDWLLAGELSR